MSTNRVIRKAMPVSVADLDVVTALRLRNLMT